MKYLIVSSSLSANSRSRILAHLALKQMQEAGHEVQLLDLRDLPLPLCDGGASYAHPNVAAVGEIIAGAQGVLIATPVYNYSTNAALKNMVELTGKNAWTNKVIGFLAAAGGPSSYMAVLGIANSLLLDFRCTVVPRFVYATKAAFEDQALHDEDVAERIQQLSHEVVRYTEALVQ